MKATWVVITMLVVGGLTVSANVGAQAEPIEGYTLIGEDPAGDFPYKLAEQGDPSGLFGTGKIDIIRLDAGLDGDTLNLRMTLPGDTSYGGLGNHMWVVQFDVDGTSYDACWTIITAGTSAMSNDVQENVRGCSMFGETDVGPRTKADGVRVVQEDGQWFIEWPMSVDAVGGVGATMENIVATTWARTGDTDDSPTEYQFELHDVAPNEGAWEYVVGASAGDETSSPLSLNVEESNATAGPGSWLVFEVGVSSAGNATSNASFEASGPEGWDAAVVAGQNATFNASTNESLVEVHVGVPEDAENGTYNVTVSALMDGNETASVDLTVTVDTSLEAVDERPAALDDTDHGMDMGNETAGNGTAQDIEDDALIPAPAPILAAGVLLAGAVWLRRRRETL